MFRCYFLFSTLSLPVLALIFMTSSWQSDLQPARILLWRRSLPGLSKQEAVCGEFSWDQVWDIVCEGHW